MSEAFTPLSVSEAIAAAHRIFDRADKALSLRRALDGVPDRELISIVILARQLDEIARASARVEHAWHPPGDDTPSDTAAAIDAAEALHELLRAAGYLPLPETYTAEEPAHGEG